MPRAEELAEIERASGKAPFLYVAARRPMTDVLDGWENDEKKKLARTEDDAALDDAIAEICERMKDDRRKHRVVFYYLLAEKFGMLEELKG